MKKLLLLLLLFGLVVVPARAEYDYDSWVTSPEALAPFETIINGTIVSIIEQDVDDAGQIPALIIISLDDDRELPIALREYRPQNTPLSVETGWKARFVGAYRGVLPVKSDLGFYIAMPVFETDQLMAVPPERN